MTLTEGLNRLARFVSNLDKKNQEIPEEMPRPVTRFEHLEFTFVMRFLCFNLNQRETYPASPGEYHVLCWTEHGAVLQRGLWNGCQWHTPEIIAYTYEGATEGIA